MNKPKARKGPAPKKQEDKYSQVFKVQLTPSEKEDLAMVAAEKGWTMTDFFRLAIDNYIVENKIECGSTFAPANFGTLDERDAAHER